MPQTLRSESLSIARGLVATGISVIPWRNRTKEPAYPLLPRVRTDDGERAAATWAPFTERFPTDDELSAWFGDGSCGIAVVCGHISGGLVILDIEQVAAYEQWCAYAADLLEAGVLQALPVVRTGRGKHVYFRMERPIGNQILARRQRASAEGAGRPGWELLAETRGQGGLAVTAPTIHPSGVAYTLEHGRLDRVPMLTEAQAQAVLDAARALGDESVASATPAGPYTTRSTSLIKTFNQATDIRCLLERHGYRPHGERGYIRPGGTHASVVIIGGSNHSLHFNTNDALHHTAPDGHIQAQTPFNIFCLLEHAGNVRAAVGAAAKMLGTRETAYEGNGTNGNGATGAGGTSLAEHASLFFARAADAADLGSEHQRDATWPYFEETDSSGRPGLWMFQPPLRDTPRPPLQLCNFTARITTEIEIDDGAERQSRYVIVATCGERSRVIEMSRDEFESDSAISRLVAALGARARLNPRADARFVRDAIKVFSAEVASQTIFAYTGWIDDHRRFLLGNGSVDAGGWQSGSGAQLPARLQQYHLDETDLQSIPISTALATFDRLLELAPAAVVIPLVGAVLLPPVAWTIGIAQPMVHVYGITGSHKTALTCAVMALWGRFSPAQPTDTWTSTPNSIQKLGWYLKDAPFLLDDYKTAHIKPAQVTFLLQNYGDGMARGRLDANAEARSAFPIRATLISSGEDQPDGEASALARILSVPLARGQVNRAKLTAVQAQAHTLPVLLVDYLAWLATQPPVVRGNRERHSLQRAQVLAALEAASAQATNPGRIASNVAALGIAWQTFGTYLKERGYWREERVTTWLGLCAQHLQQLAAAQLDLVTDERYSVQFLNAVRGVLATGRAQLQNLDVSTAELVKPPALIGGYDGSGTYLLPSAYDEVRKYRHQMGMPLLFGQKALLQMLEQEGLLLSTDDHSRKPQKAIIRYIDGKRHRCWHLPPGILFEPDES